MQDMKNSIKNIKAMMFDLDGTLIDSVPAYYSLMDRILETVGLPHAPKPLVAEFMTHVDEWEQATYLLHALELGQQDNSVGPMIIWNLNFGPLLGYEYSESGYSILRPDGSRRPAYHSLEHAKKA